MLLRLSRISKAFGPLQVLEDVSFEVGRGEKIGLVGSNGSGKTTIFRLALGELDPDRGDIFRVRNIHVAYMPQAVEVRGAQTLRAFVLAARADLHRFEEELRELEEEIQATPDDDRLLLRIAELHEILHAEGAYRMGSQCDSILAGLGFAPESCETPLDRLSGGERTKAALARILLESPDLLLLDEPTNHLDIWAASWLEEYLRRSPCAAIIVSHDRYFLDRVAERIVELTGGRTTTYRGNYSAYVDQREERRLVQEREYEKQRSFILKEEDFIRRYHYAQRAREARGRRKKLARIERLERPTTEKTLSLKLAGAREQSVFLARLTGVAKAFGEREIFSDVTFELMRGDKVGLIGPNGAGKTTLLRLIIGEETPTRGEVKRGKVAPGYYDQHQQSLDDDHTILDAIAVVKPKFTIPELRSAAGRFLFSRDDAEKRVGNLSGGERARLALAKLVLAEPSFLVLDEPTNHLDIASRETVEDALAAYDGSMLLVTHDRYLLDAVVDRLLVLKDGAVRLFPGDYTDWRESVERAERERAETGSTGKGGRPVSNAEAFRLDQKDRDRTRRRRERRLAAVEETIETLEVRQREILAAFEKPELYGDRARVAELAAENERIVTDLARAYEEWEAIGREGAAEAEGEGR